MREEGYYFVKIEDEWDIAKYYKFKLLDKGGFWNSIDWDSFRQDLDFDEIGDKIDLPNN